MSNIINKVKNALSNNPNTTTGTGTAYNTTGTGTASIGEGVTGPHNSRVANSLDPRVDSDLDGSTHLGGTTATTTTGPGFGHTGGHHHVARDAALGGAGAGLADHEHREHYKHHSTTGTGHVGRDAIIGGAGVGLVEHEHAAAGTGTGLGPHSSSLLNKLDPRVDSSTGWMKEGTTTGMTGSSNYPNTSTVWGLSSSTNAGPHNSNLANKLDPRVDSDLDGRGNRYATPTGGILGTSGSHVTPGSGTAQNTAGPHNSDLANQLDPRVDSNLDGSSTIGGNRTYAASGKDPRDAAHVTPSILREHIGHPEIRHNDPKSDHQGRHGSISNQVADRDI